MIAELLRFTTRGGMRDAFVERNERVWAPALRGRAGYIRHEVLLDRDDPDEVVVLVRWRSEADMRAFPDGLEQALNERMGDLATLRERTVYESADAPGGAGRG